jgi:hypothetical protein
MPLPPDLPDQFTARLCGIVHALLEHSILRGNRQVVREPAEGAACIPFHAGLDQAAGTAFLVDFPEVSDSVPTSLGRVSATVSVEGTPTGAYDHATGHVAIDVDLVFNPRHMLARTSRVRVHLETRTAIEEPELRFEGAPLSLSTAVLVLTGRGTFEGGSLDGGTIWLAVTCEVEQLEIEEEA